MEDIFSGNRHDKYNHYCTFVTYGENKELSRYINLSIKQEIKPLPNDLVPLVNLVMYLGDNQADKTNLYKTKEKITRKADQ